MDDWLSIFETFFVLLVFIMDSFALFRWFTSGRTTYGDKDREMLRLCSEYLDSKKKRAELERVMVDQLDHWLPKQLQEHGSVVIQLE